MKRRVLKFPLILQLSWLGTAIFPPFVATAAEKFSAAIADPCAKYDFYWKTEPAFLAESTISIVADGGISRATVTYSKDRVSAPKSEQLSVTDEASRKLCAALLRLLAIPERNDRRLIYDGIVVEGSLRTANSAPQNFSFHSPTKSQTPREFGIADAVFVALEDATVSCELNVYLERLSGYFPFGLPAKVVAAEPLTLRFYGNFSLGHYQELQTLLSKLSTSRSIRIDVTNFERMGTMYYPDFRRLISEVPDLSWTASENSARMLAEIGVKPEKIRIVDGPSCGGERVRFTRR